MEYTRVDTKKLTTAIARVVTALKQADDALDDLTVLLTPGARSSLLKPRDGFAAAARTLAKSGDLDDLKAAVGYDSEAVVKAIHSEPLGKPDTPELYRQHFRLLREGLKQWMSGATHPIGMPDYPSFVQGVVGALDHVRTSNGSNVLIVSSGGPISTAVGHLLGTSAETTIELNFRIRNTSITEFSFNPKRHVLLSFNHLPHLDDPVYADWQTYA